MMLAADRALYPKRCRRGVMISSRTSASLNPSREGGSCIRSFSSSGITFEMSRAPRRHDGTDELRVGSISVLASSG